MSPESEAYASTIVATAFPPAAQAPRDVAPTEEEAPPAQLGDRYHLVRFLGRGGFGAVYEAVDERLDKRVAVKLLASRRSASDNAFERFQAEALATSRLSHPSIVAVTDFALLPDGRPFLVMEYVSGATLQALLAREGCLPVLTAVNIAQAIATALAAAHGCGVVHRDLKPANIIVNQAADGLQVKILDFGVAKLAATNSASSLTKTGQLIGTPAYMAPEQVREKHGAVDGRSDIYALGMVLYEMLTGQTAFPGNSVSDVMMAHLLDHPQPPSSVREDLPEGLDAVVLRALAKRPERRYRDAAAFAQALGEFSSDAALLRRRGPKRAVLLFVSALAAMSLVSLGLSRHAPRAPALSVTAPALPTSEAPSAPSIEKRETLAAVLPERTAPPSVPDGARPRRAPRQRVSVADSAALPDAPLATFRASPKAEAKLERREAEASPPGAQADSRKTLKVAR
jgi:serine/threonine protein kinase